MKFYFREQVIGKTNKVLRTAHIAKDANNPRSGCLCNRPFNLEKWLFVEQLPEETHLCKSCESIARRNLVGAGPAGR